MVTKTENFLNTIKSGALESWTKYKILPSIVAAQAILESGWGTSKLAIQANNLFGIKADSSWKGEKYLVTTNEYINGIKTEINANFRKYKSWSDSVADHGEFLSKPRYKNAINETDYKYAINAIFRAGYATDPVYPSKIIRLIEQYNLNNWDKEAIELTSSNKNVKYYVQTGQYDTKEQAEAAAKKIVDSKIAWVVEVKEVK